MPYVRRSDDRRRRVLLSNGGMGPAAVPGTRSFHRDVSPRPVVAYGKRARRPLRGRWFALVPLTRLALTQFTAVILLATCALVGTHYLTLTVPALGTRSAWVNVFQSDAPGSMGRFIQAGFLGLSAAAAYLVYQLRRHRNDDFHGQYRLWRWMISLFVISAVTTMVPLIELLGGVLEWGIGRRVALSGADWMRLLGSIACFAVAVQSVIELRRHLAAMLWMLLGWSAVTTPVAMQWHGIEITTPLTATIASNAWLVGASAWLLGTVWYLKCLVREVRCLPQQPGFFANWFAANEGEDEVEPKSNRRERKRATSRAPSKQVDEVISAKNVSPKKRDATQAAKRVDVAAERQRDDDVEAGGEKPKRTWFGLRRRKRAPEDAEVKPEAEAKPEIAKAKRSVPKRDDPVEETAKEPKKRRFGLGRFLSRGEKDASSHETEPQPAVQATQAESKPNVSAASKPSGGGDGTDAETDQIDWSSLSKAERRRLRKQLKRSGRAA
ncbi:MAG: hypothetical protein AAGD07_09855 [Planctomycetota bacterium]